MLAQIQGSVVCEVLDVGTVTDLPLTFLSTTDNSLRRSDCMVGSYLYCSNR